MSCIDLDETLLMVSIRAQTEFNCARGGRGGVVGRKTRQERANLQKNGFAGISGGDIRRIGSALR